jgi:hypothetical protein
VTERRGRCGASGGRLDKGRGVRRLRLRRRYRRAPGAPVRREAGRGVRRTPGRPPSWAGEVACLQAYRRSVLWRRRLRGLAPDPTRRGQKCGRRISGGSGAARPTCRSPLPAAARSAAGGRRSDRAGAGDEPDRLFARANPAPTSHTLPCRPQAVSWRSACHLTPPAVRSPASISSLRDSTWPDRGDQALLRVWRMWARPGPARCWQGPGASCPPSRRSPARGPRSCTAAPTRGGR